jgi:hypothetical protein
MPSSFLSDPAAETSAPVVHWQSYSQIQQQPNQGSATAPLPSEPEPAPLEDDELDEASPASDDPEPSGSSDSDDPPAGNLAPAGADPLRAERRRSNQLEKELRKARAQLARFSEINPDEYARLQEAERKREEQERQWNLREQELNNANRRRVQAVEKERDDAREQALTLRKERLLERLFIDAEGRVGGDERSSFFDTFCKLCGGQFRLSQSDGRERLEPIDAAGQPYALDGVALSAADYMEELRRHPVYSFLFQQRNGLYQSSAEGGYDSAGVPVNLQAMSTRELYMEAMRGTTPRVPARS